jgi:hypothetical protein
MKYLKVPSLESDKSFDLEFGTTLLMDEQSNSKNWFRCGGSSGIHSTHLQSLKSSDFKLILLSCNESFVNDDKLPMLFSNAVCQKIKQYKVIKIFKIQHIACA